MSQIRHSPIASTHTEARASGDVIDRHRHDDHQLIYVSSGVLTIRTSSGAWVASRERAVWVPAGIWHEHRFYGDSAFHTVGFPLDEAPLSASSPVVVAVDALLGALLVAGTDPDLPADQARRIRGVLRDRLGGAATAALNLPIARDARLAEACRLVEDDLSRPRTLTWLARSVSTSERTLARLFRAEFATTYPQWRTTVRVCHAMIHLAEGATVTETAHHCGWATPSAFIDTFARAVGQTPGTYRTAAVRTRSPIRSARRGRA